MTRREGINLFAMFVAALLFLIVALVVIGVVGAVVLAVAR